VFFLAYIEIYVFRGNPFNTHSLQDSYHLTQSVPIPQPTAQLPSNTIHSNPTAYSTVTIQHNPFQSHSLQYSYQPTQSVLVPQPTTHLPSNKIRSSPTAYSTVTIKCMCKNNIKLVYLPFTHCTCKFEKHKQSFASEKYKRTRHAHERATSA
jgi:hypothetical protein